LDEPLALALQALSRKERTVAELGSWLRARGVGTDDVELVVGHLAESGTLDDRRFAVRYAEDKRELSGWGEERIRLALSQRGVPEDDIAEALESAADEEATRAAAALRKRGASPCDALERNRAFGFLVRRGFSAEVAYEAVRRASGDDD
jgi:regulatory protein